MGNKAPISPALRRGLWGKGHRPAMGWSRYLRHYIAPTEMNGETQTNVRERFRLCVQSLPHRSAWEGEDAGLGVAERQARPVREY